MSDVVFNGYRLELKSGQRFSAKATRINLLAPISPGEYLVNPTSITNNVFFPGTRALNQCNAPKQTLATNHILELQPSRKLYTPISPLYLYDFSETHRRGIRAEQSFFMCLDFGRRITPSQGYTLTVKYAAPWMQTAELELGQKETSGKKVNPRILEYFNSSKFWGKDDSGAENAWCASFTAWVMELNGYKPPANAFRAKSWGNFGKKIEKPVYGAIGIKSRQGGGHVAFVVGKSSDGKKLYMLGGNQGDEVNVSEYPASVWETFVVPSNYNASLDSLPIYTQPSSKSGSES